MPRQIRAAAIAVLLLATACTGNDNDASSDEGQHGPTDTPANSTFSTGVVEDLATMRMATARYATDLDAALADGYFMITRHMPNQGYHFLNPNADGFDPSQPQILMYANHGDQWQLVGFEWVWPEQPAAPPMEGATYGSFPAACHYEDGLFVEVAAEDNCEQEHPESGAAFTFWHPDLVTLHVWAWLHNPAGLFHPTNPLMAAYAEESGEGGEAPAGLPGRYSVA